jgi:hypothetical protein
MLAMTNLNLRPADRLRNSCHCEDVIILKQLAQPHEKPPEPVFGLPASHRS